MTSLHRAPFRADHVGSFLRPKVLLEAREQRQNGQITAEQLRTVEDAAIRDVVKFQEDIGLQGITDGEYRRTYFHIDFLEQLQGVETKGGIQVSFRKADGTVDFSPPVMQVTGKIGHARPIQLADFEFLKSVTTRVPKVTIPFSSGCETVSVCVRLRPKFFALETNIRSRNGAGSVMFFRCAPARCHCFGAPDQSSERRTIADGT